MIIMTTWMGLLVSRDFVEADCFTFRISPTPMFAGMFLGSAESRFSAPA